MRFKEIPYYLAIGFIRLYKAIELFFLKVAATFFINVEDLTKEFLPKDITINGVNPWDIQVHNKNIYLRVANLGTLGFGEGYMAGEIDCNDLTEMIYRAIKHGFHKLYWNRWNWFLNWLEFSYFNNQDRVKSYEVGEKHYDLGNDLYETMLGKTMLYTCAYWRTATNLEQAQQDKLDLIGKKLMLKPGMKVLDLGCGYGYVSKYLAENYGCHVLGVTISKEQCKLAAERYQGPLVEFKFTDYRDLFPTHIDHFDRIVALEVIEHVGHNNYEEFFRICSKLLKKDGLLLIQAIGLNHYGLPLSEPWTEKYIFPNLVLPYYKHITKFIEKRFIIEDWHNFGFDFYKTLNAWDENFQRGWPELRGKYGDEFYRMWRFYLNMSAGLFKGRVCQLWQVVLSKDGIEGGYYAAR